jgi:hypothetical protein
MRQAKRIAAMLGSVIVVLMLAIVVDEVAYFRWREQMTRWADQVEREVAPQPMFFADGFPAHPYTFGVKNDGTVGISFEPPPLAWTYYLSSKSRVGFNATEPIYRWMWRQLGERVYRDDFWSEVIGRHTPYTISIIREKTGHRIVTVEHGGAF